MTLGWYHVFHNDTFDFRSFAAVSFSVILPSATKIELEANTLSNIFVNSFGNSLKLKLHNQPLIKCSSA